MIFINTKNRLTLDQLIQGKKESKSEFTQRCLLTLDGYIKRGHEAYISKNSCKNWEEL